jgi:uncharacterized protein (DUF2062 family)
MLAFLRQLARAITGKVDPLEFALGIFFGLLLGLLPAAEIDPGTGLMGFNGLWMLVLVVFLVLKASIPVAVVFAALGKLLGVLFVDQAAYSFGKSTLDSMSPDGLAASWQRGAGSLQLHTYWGFGAAVFALLIAMLITVPFYFVMKRKLPQWRERFAQSKLAKVLSGFILFRAIAYLLR